MQFSSSTSSPKRANALDALRGFAVLTMVLSGVIPRAGALPAWMYHAQTPPPTHIFNPNLPGITWVDLVFPIFLFSMGASIPLSLSRLKEKGWHQSRIVLFVLKRGFLLGTFAIFLHHIRPNIIDNTNQSPTKWWIGLLGFAILLLMYARWPKSWWKWLRILLTISGWSLCVLLLTKLRYANGSGFLLERSDIILIVLTNMAVFASLIWLFTRSHLWLRVGILGILLGLRLSSTTDGWVADFWFASPMPWIFRFDYLKYLFIAIPGTIIGDLIYEWMGQSPVEISHGEASTKNVDLTTQKSDRSPCWNHKRLAIIILLTLTINIVLLIGLQSRLVGQTTLMTGILFVVGWLLLKKTNNSREILLKKLYYWGVYWLALGLAFEPFQGGIKKDSATYSYFFLTAGIAIFMLITFIIIIDYFQQKWLLSLFIHNGQNPMLAYVVFGNLLLPILKLTELHPAIVEITPTPWLGFLRGVAYMLMVGYIVSIFSRLKLFWRT